MKKLFSTLLLLGIVFSFAALASATTITIDDNTIYWDSWANGTGDDERDSIGSPDFPDLGAGQLEIATSSGYLSSVNISYNRYNSAVFMGDLFIDVDGDSNWDYVINPDRETGTATGYKVLGNFGVAKTDYITSDGYTYLNSDGYGYIVSNYYFSTWDTDSYREDHPVGAANLDDTALFSNLGMAYFTPYDEDVTTDVVFYGLTDFGITITSDTIIAIAANCANDVIYERVPEPSTMLLFGIGLIGLAGMGRRRYVK